MKLSPLVRSIEKTFSFSLFHFISFQFIFFFQLYSLNLSLNSIQFNSIRFDYISTFFLSLSCPLIFLTLKLLLIRNFEILFFLVHWPRRISASVAGAFLYHNFLLEFIFYLFISLILNFLFQRL